MAENKKGPFSGKRKIIWIVAAVIVLAVIIVLIRGRGAGDNGASEGYDYGQVAAPLARRDLSGSINVSGTVESREVLAVTTELANSKIKELDVALGDRVEAGDVLCTFDDETIKEQIEAYEQQLSETEIANAQALAAAQRQLAIYNADDSNDLVTAAQESLDAAESKRLEYYNSMNDYLALRDNYEQGSSEWYEMQHAADAAYEQMTEQEKILAKAQQTLTLAQLQQDSARISQEEGVASASRTASSTSELTKQLSTLYNQLKQTTITADQPGVVTKLNVQKGAIASGTLMQIEDDGKLRVKVNIREKDIIKLESGMKVRLTADAFPDQTFSGEVAQVINFTSSTIDIYTGETASSSSGSGYSAYINVEDGTPLLLGMTVKAEILVDASEPVLAVGYDAILYDENGAAYVLCAETQGDDSYTAKRVDVTVGASGDYYTEIMGDGLEEGMLILSFPYDVADGDVIEVEIVDDTSGGMTDGEFIE